MTKSEAIKKYGLEQTIFQYDSEHGTNEAYKATNDSGGKIRTYYLFFDMLVKRYFLVIQTQDQTRTTRTGLFPMRTVVKDIER